MPDEIELGRQLAVENCGACHATGTEDASTLAAAPAFRDLGQRYPVSHLEEALAEGIVTGHDAMPEIEWDTDQIIAFIAYLETIQTQ
ncbi:c-type cytochrome [Breoghania sp. L-A4]|uniref:c-type cytochrome n=1 Tax=Breoghania sp. L-A4 TaxID=2304600 RepID=UPI00196853F3|nr:c-type cytochrome [Breoghania sp. L-A4]